MFKIYDGRQDFYQWDLDRKLIVSDPAINQVHFSDIVDGTALVCEVYELDGLRVANVPNILLQTEWKINAYAYLQDHTKVSASFKVIARPKPDSYVYTETEVKNYDALAERIEEVAAAGIPYAPTVNIWELDEGVYRIAGGFQWGQYEPPTNPRYMYITSGLLIVSVETRINDARVYTVIADNKIYYGKSTPFEVINADTGKKEVHVDGNVNYIEKVEKIDDMTTAKFGVPSSGAVKKYIDSFGLKTLTLGNLQKAYIQNLETGIYCVTVEEGGRAGVYAGKSAHHVMDTAYLIVGGSNYTETTADKEGITLYNKSYILIHGITNQAFYYAGLIRSEKLDGVWTHTKVGGDAIETKDNKAFAIDETIRDHTKYISALAVKEYVDGAIAAAIPASAEEVEY